MSKERRVGHGVTRHVRNYYNGSDPADIKKFYADATDFIGYPWENFPEWLAKYEKRLAGCAEKQRLPTAADILVVYDRANRGDWYATDEIESSKVIQDPEYCDSHRFEEPATQFARYYLTATDADPTVEASWGWQWGYQSVRWYIGTLMGLALDCRRALEKESWLELAGRCIELGKMDREFILKFSGDRHVHGFQVTSERQVKAIDAANAKRRKKMEAWQAVAMEIAGRMPFEDRSSASAIADFVLAHWPEGKPPGKDRLRKYIAEAWPHLKRDQL